MSIAYLITWRCYGTYLHGDEGAVDRHNNTYGESRRVKSPRLYQAEREQMYHQPFMLTPRMRELVTTAIEATAMHKGWNLLAVNARSNHVHVVVSTDGPPEIALTTFKAWSTRSLRKESPSLANEPIWARHGSTRYLFTDDAVTSAIHYVLEQQDAPERFE